LPSDFGLDIGSCRTIIYSPKEQVLSEASVVAVETKSGEPLAYGDEAEPMIGRTPKRITAVSPIERGAIANYDAAEHMIQHFLETVSNKKIFKARVAIATPSGITPVEQRSFYDACVAAGARDVCMVESPIAAAIGLDINFDRPRGVIIVDIGAGTTDVAVLSMGGLSRFESAHIGGMDFNESLVKYVRKKHKILIGDHTAEEIKLNIGSVKIRELTLTLISKGINQLTGLPQFFEINSNEICKVYREVMNSICKAIGQVIERTPPEMVADIYSDGLILTGGASLMFGLPEFLGDYLGVTIKTVDDPVGCVAAGIGKALRTYEFMRGRFPGYRLLDK